jgi:hypothetical protein
MDYKTLLSQAKEARDLGDPELELAILEKADKLKTSEFVVPQYAGMEAWNNLPLTRGISNQAQRQVVGLSQMADDFNHWLDPESVGFDPEVRAKLDAKGRELNEQADKAPLGEKAGGMLALGIESMALPFVGFKHGKTMLEGAKNWAATLPKRGALNAGTAGILAALNPADSGDQRLSDTAMGATLGAVLPEAIAGASGGVRGITGAVRSAVQPKWGAARELARKFEDRNMLPLQAPTRGEPRQNIPDDLAFDGVGPVKPDGGRFSLVEGVEPTAGMLTDNTPLLNAEMVARTRSPEFFTRDQDNQRAIYEALNRRSITDAEYKALKKKLNDATTPMREDAFNVIRGNQSQVSGVPAFAKPMSDKIDELTTTPGSRMDPGLMAVARDGISRMDPPGTAQLDPEDIYNFRKTGINDRLSSPANDQETNQVKNARRYVMQIKEAIDEGMNAESGGKFGEYLNAYQHGLGGDAVTPYVAGMRQIDEPYSFGKMLDEFNLKPRLADGVTPEITPYALRKAVDKNTFKDIGDETVSTVGPRARAVLDDAKDVMNSIEKTKKGTVSVTGSPTATFLTNLVKSSVVPGSKVKSIINILDAIGSSVGARNLDMALLNPSSGVLDDILKAYHNPASENTSRILNQLTNAAAQVGRVTPSMGR